MAIRRGRFSFADGDILDEDDLTSLEAQTIRPVADRAGLTAVFGAAPKAGLAWLENSFELVGWDGTKWVTITTGFSYENIAGRISGVTQGPITQQPENDFWHEPAVETRVSARAFGLTGASTKEATPVAVSANATLNFTRMGGVFSWRQDNKYGNTHVETITAVADCDVQVLLIGPGGNGAHGRNINWQSSHPQDKGVLLAGGGGGSGEVRDITLRLTAGQTLRLTGLGRIGDPIRAVKDKGIVCAALAGGGSVTADPQSQFYTSGLAAQPLVPPRTAPNAGASQWTFIYREHDRLTNNSGATWARFFMIGDSLNGGATDTNLEARYDTSGFGGGKSFQPYWYVPTAYGDNRGYLTVTFRPNRLGGAGAGGSMIKAGENAKHQTVDGKEGGYNAGGTPVVLDTDYWPARYGQVAPGGHGHTDRQVHTNGSATKFDRAPVSSAAGAGGNGAVGEFDLRGINFIPRNVGNVGAALIRFSRAGRPLTPYKVI